MIEELSKSPYFTVIAGFASILGLFIAVFVPMKIYKWYKNKQKIKIGSQEIHGDNNTQAGGNINNQPLNQDCIKITSKINIKKQTISGNNNIQSGGDINGEI